VRIFYRPTSEPRLADSADWLQFEPGRTSVRFEDIQFTVEDGRSIRIETDPATPAYDIRVWLLGSVMAILLHQRGSLPVHANIVALGEGKAAAFAGDSGAGKSTLATWFDTRGWRVLGDDLCAIRLTEAGEPQLFEGIPRVKLWSDTLDMFGRTTSGLEKVASDLDKFHVPMSRSRLLGSLEPLGLERLYVLDRAAEGRPFAIVPVSGAAAAQAVLANAFRWELGQRIQPPRTQFDQCMAVARHTRAFRIERRWGFDHFKEDCEAIEQHLEMPLEELGGA
jgi:hypothetical protein